MCSRDWSSDVCSSDLFAPLMGTAACASTVKRTSPLAGAENVRPPAANTATLGLLAGTTSMYWAQFAPVGLPIGQLLLAVMENKPVEFTARPPAAALVRSEEQT